MRPIKQSPGVSRVAAAPAAEAMTSGVVPSIDLATLGSGLLSAITTYGPPIACAVCKQYCG